MPQQPHPVLEIPLAGVLGDLDATKCKLHCAIWNGEDRPIDVLARDWDEWVGWSRYRGKRDGFNRDFHLHGRKGPECALPAR
jgi:hypothetical protein